MLFNSYIFIFAFLPLCLAGFYLLEHRRATLAKMWLIAMSLWFYGYFNLNYLVIMIFSILFNYLMFRLIREGTGKRRKCLLMAGVFINLLILFYFKYYDFFIQNCNLILGKNLPLKNVLLPLGISFFTFQQIGFIADTYRGEIEDCPFVDYTLFVCFFPQLIAGPIVNHDEMLPQFRAIGKRHFDFDKLLRGVYIFILGMSKKVLIADTFGKAVDLAYVSLPSGINAFESVLTILFYTLQLYFDFSGYCDMAIGLGNMLGIDIPVNFNSPYKATNIIDFWKRWHITLSRFFTKNIYIPLGGNRRGRRRMFINLFIVFFLSGLWHGAGWNYIVWGCMHGLLYVITRAYMLWKKERKVQKDNNNRIITRLQTAICVMLTFAFVNMAWTFFRAPSCMDAVKLISGIWKAEWNVPGLVFAECFNISELWYVLKVLHLTELSFGRYFLMIFYTIVALAMVFFAPNVHELADRTQYRNATAVLMGILLVWCIISLSGVSTFLYFNF